MHPRDPPSEVQGPILAHLEERGLEEVIRTYDSELLELTTSFEDRYGRSARCSRPELP